jgi:hypothetical protein
MVPFTDANHFNQGGLFQNIKNSSYPLYDYLHFDDKIVSSPLQWLIQDGLFRHAVLLQVSVYKARMRQQPPSPATLKYHQVTLALLSTRLSDQTQTPLTNTTIWGITILANSALWLGRYDEIAVHIRALKRICHLYGGKDFILQKPTLRYYVYW